MTTQQELERLSSLRKEIAALSVVKCRMSHERIRREPDSMLPVLCRFPEGAYQRVGLCSPETRAQRLACSHTMARVRLSDAIRELRRSGAGCSGALSDELNRIDNQIHLLDHLKGEQETSVARMLAGAYGADDRSPECEMARKAEQEVQTLALLHDGYVDQIGILRDSVLTEMDRLIERRQLVYSTFGPASAEGKVL